MENSNSTQAESTLTVNKLKKLFFSLKINKGPSYKDISPLLKPLMAIFNLSLQKGLFLEELNIARVRAIYKADDVNEIGNYRPISDHLVFQKY